ncbi:MAG: hypothetical protein NW237_14500 [Cyanobacteriota bacterium]|nr:hypothetical protein [Cyanobacteriota bacterium]
MMPIPALSHDLHYRALGLIKGTLQRISDHQGLLLTEDGQEYPATPGRAQILKKFSQCLDSPQPHWFYVQPQPRPGGVLGLGIIRILGLPEEEQDPAHFEAEFPLAPPDMAEGFHIRGDIQIGKGTITVSVKRKPQGAKQFPPLQIPLEGFLPGSNDGEFWDLQAEREGQSLVLMDGSRVLPARSPAS